MSCCRGVLFKATDDQVSNPCPDRFPIVKGGVGAAMEETLAEKQDVLMLRVTAPSFAATARQWSPEQAPLDPCVTYPQARPRQQSITGSISMALGIKDAIV